MTTLSQLDGVIAKMSRFAEPWWVAGGWALDLWLGGPPGRPHGDIEIGLFRRDQRALRSHLTGWAVSRSVEDPGGKRWAPLAAGEDLIAPAFQLRARPPDQGAHLPTELHVFLEDSEGGRWAYRRDPAIRVPIADLTVVSASGVPVLAPHIQLLYKAGGHRDKDEGDFARVSGRLSPGARAWLQDALKRWRPDDPWIPLLGRR